MNETSVVAYARLRLASAGDNGTDNNTTSNFTRR